MRPLALGRKNYGPASPDEAEGREGTPSVIHSRTILPAAVFNRIRAALDGSGADGDRLVAVDPVSGLCGVTWH